MKRFIAMLLTLLVSCVAIADETDAAREKMIKDGIRVCQKKGFSTVGERDKCVTEFTTKANERFPVRGSETYARKHYAGMGKSQAEAALIKLRKEWEAAPRGGYFSARRAGPASQKAIAEEGWWIQTNILGVRQSQDDPWFMECKGYQTANIVRRCPLGKGGDE
ncbi:hypothetical protein [Pseudomonas sp. RIT-PI-AD]|uniref:hypothetical protein n=1 Tax=Pseudomonas sp. RIT-PI-AD TaxID=3035294 RepID=UPI0021D7D368|nr:hypothetical protein [Pseudomonas sp. RIT-PI-AD]